MADEPPSPKPRRKPQEYFPFEDDLVRDMLNRAGFPPNVEEKVQRFVNILQFAEERLEAHEQRRTIRTRFVIWLLSALGVAVVGLSTNLVGQVWLPWLHELVK